MDRTLASIIAPMLRQLKETKHGFPYTYLEDAPHIPNDTNEEYQFGDDDNGGYSEARWSYILDEMIFAFETLTNDDWDLQFHKDEDWEEEEVDTDYGKGITRIPKNDVIERRQAFEARMDNGFRLFGRYYRSLWD
jgi:hypothetical protein